MKVFKKIVELQNELFYCRKENKTVGLVPTMGALHEGHASLVKRSVEENDVTVVSVFLNPTQFNDKGDLERYPRTLEADCQLLEDCGADYVFAPSVEEIYPEPDNRHYEFPPQSTVMEGAKRPGHFNGVCQVVSRLFYIVRPVRAYFGEKDWQQIAVIKRLVDFIGMKDVLEIVECPIVRDADGLAKSSRNMLLTADERSIAPRIFEVLGESVEYSKTHSVVETHDKVVADINAVDGLEVEYFEIVDGNTLLEVNTWEAYVVGCITVYCGKTPIRLIDHIKYRR
ncbi:MAG: pantoate--beta-alanine ligase [Prevotella fusca]|uniref:pantoate--beta-alanine ligase n=1 Tax=Prevotella fusca TaxID=589436 RepID=UPI003FA07F78